MHNTHRKARPVAGRVVASVAAAGAVVISLVVACSDSQTPFTASRPSHLPVAASEGEWNTAAIHDILTIAPIEATVSPTTQFIIEPKFMLYDLPALKSHHNAALEFLKRVHEAEKLTGDYQKFATERFYANGYILSSQELNYLALVVDTRTSGYIQDCASYLCTRFCEETLLEMCKASTVADRSFVDFTYYEPHFKQVMGDLLNRHFDDVLVIMAARYERLRPQKLIRSSYEHKLH